MTDPLAEQNKSYDLWLDERSHAQAVSTIPIQAAYVAGFKAGRESRDAEYRELLEAALDALTVMEADASKNNWIAAMYWQGEFMRLRELLANLIPEELKNG